MKSSTLAETWSWLLLVLGSVVFVVLRWEDLSLPLFWDELGVYGPGVFSMLDHGIGLLPSSLDPELSRGHPLFFYAFYAGYAWTFGTDLLVLRIPGILLTISLAWTIWLVGRSFLSEATAALAGGLFLAMPAVFAQSGLILPEMMLSLLILLSLYFAAQEKFWPYLIVAGLAILTKETGILIPLAVSVWHLFRKTDQKWRKALIALSPLMVFCLFLSIQRIQNGWFFFPYHEELISFAWSQISFKGGEMLEFLFWTQNRWVFLPIAFIGILVFTGIWKTSIPEQQASWVLLSGIFVVGMMTFTVVNAYMDRYLLAILPLLCMWAVWVLDCIFGMSLAWIVSGIIILVFLNSSTGDQFRYDVDPGYTKVVQVQQEATAFLVSEVPDSAQVYANFPLFLSFSDPRSGYISELPSFSLTVRPRDSVDMIATITPGVPWTEGDLSGESLQKEIVSGYSHCEIYLTTP